MSADADLYADLSVACAATIAELREALRREALVNRLIFDERLSRGRDDIGYDLSYLFN